MHSLIRLSLIAIITALITTAVYLSGDSSRAQHVRPSAAIAVSCVPAPPAMVSWWPGDGNANDIRGGNNGTLNGGATATAAGKVAQSFTFNGASEMTVPDAPSLNVQTFTVDAWVFPTTVDGANDIIFNKEDAGATVQYEMSIRGPQFSGGTIPQGNLAIFIGGVTGLPNDEAGWVNGNGPVPLNTWTHVAMTFDGSSAKVYINGSLTRTISGLGGNVTTTSGAFKIGARTADTGFADSFNGSIDEFELFNRALDITEIQNIFNADSAGKCRPRCATPPAGLVSWWTGDDSPFDRQGTNHGALQNGATFGNGKVGRAFSLDGVDDQVTVTHNANQNTGGGITIDAWINPTSSGHGRPILQKRSGANVGGYDFETTHTPSGPANGLQFAIWIGGTAQVLQTPANVLVIGVWQHVAATYDGTTMRIYVNGAERSNMSVSGAIDEVTDPIVIGKNVVTSAAWLGLIDEIELYNRALSALEIQTLNNSGAAGKCKQCVAPPANMVGWWNGDANGNDISGSGNNGTLQGGGTYASGMVGQSFNFNGGNQYVPINDSPSIRPQQLTLDAWVFPRSVGDVVDGLGAVIMAKDTGNFPGANISYGIFGPGTAGKFTSIVFFTDSTNAVATSADSFAFDQWYHVASTWDGSTLVLYVNGVVEASVNMGAKTLVYTADGAALGRHSHVGRSYDGLIDEAELFNRALTQTEIQSVIAAGRAGKCKFGCVPPPQNMIGWWPGEGGANDIQGSNNGTLQGGATFAVGKVGQAFSLDGVDDFVNIPSSAAVNFGTSDFTVDLWANFNNTSGEQVLVEKYIETLNPLTAAGWTFTKASDNSILFGVLDGSGAVNVIQSTPLTIATGTWHHFAASRGGGQITVFMDGSALASSVSSTVNVNSTSSLRFGHRGNPSETPGSNDTRGFYLSGLIDEVELFNRGLTPIEIQSIFAAGPGGKCKFAVANGISASVGDASITFPNGSTPGATSYQTLDLYQPGPMPAGYNNPLQVVDVSTTAVFSGPARICFNLPASQFAGPFTQLRVLHLEGNDLVNRTSSVQSGTSTLCADVTSFSPLVIAQNTNAPTAASTSISGRVTTSTGAPLGGVAVRLAGDRAAATITDYNGNYHFENLEASGFYTVSPLLANYTFAPACRSFSLIANRTDASFTAVPDTIIVANAIDTTEFFVRQQYLDFLGREPDQAGLDYWSGRIEECGNDAGCISARRIDVSAAFFIEQEAQLTGSFIYDVYEGSLKRRPFFAEYSVDRLQVIGGGNLDAEKTAFAQSFVQRAEFVTKYRANATADSFVDALLQNVKSSGVDLRGERVALLALYNGGSNTIESRAAVVRTIADNGAFKQSQYNAAFVLTEYFSYLRRDADPEGYNFWVNVLSNRDPGNYRGMVCSFITSEEYQRRFSAVVSHSNRECRE